MEAKGSLSRRVAALEAERKAGALLAEMPKARGGWVTDKSCSDSASEQDLSPAKLPDLGITHKQSSDWQRMAKVPAPVFEARPTFTLEGPAAPCAECGREPFAFTIDIDRASPRPEDAA